MWDKMTAHLDRIHAGPWIVLLAGVLLIAMTLLTPAWLDVHELRQQRQTIINEKNLLNQRLTNYNNFLIDIQQSDTHVLTNLAWHQLHLKPVGTQPARLPCSTEYSNFNTLIAPDVAPTAFIDTLSLRHLRLARLTSGRSRVGLITIGAMLIIASLLYSLPPSRIQSKSDTLI